MAAIFENIKTSANWRVYQISGTGVANFNTAYMTFASPVTIRRVELNLSVSTDPFLVYISRDGTQSPEQQSILVQNNEGDPAISLIHDSEFTLHLPITANGDPILAGGRLYAFVPAAVTWALTAEVKG